MKKVAIIGLCGNSLFFELDRMPNIGETKDAINLHTEIGGKGFNQAVALRRLKIDVSFMSAIGNDLEGKASIELANKEGMKSFFKIKGERTAQATILRSTNADNEVIEYLGANKLLSKEDVLDFKNEIITSDCLLLQYEIPYDALKLAINIAKENNVMIVVNPAPYIYDDIDIIKDAYLITPNEVEASKMLDISVEEIYNADILIKKIREFGLERIVITLGDKGAFVYENDKYKYIKGKKVDAVDTTGAGDVFNASLVYKLLNDETIFDACEFANIQSSKSVTKKYVIDSIPYLE